MKLQVSMELQIHNEDYKPTILSQITEATKEINKHFPYPVSSKLVQVVFLDNKDIENSHVIQIGNVILDSRAQIVSVDNKEITITPIEFKLLYLLMQRRGEVQSRSILLSDVWRIHPNSNTRTVDVHIKRLRDKLGKNNSIIQTVSGVGYIIK